MCRCKKLIPSRLHHEAFIFDLDGCIYRGNSVIEGRLRVVEAEEREEGALPDEQFYQDPKAVVEKLARMGIAANDADIMTSSIATSSKLRGRRGGIERKRRRNRWEGRYCCWRGGLCASAGSEASSSLTRTGAEADCIVCGLDTKVT